MNYFIMILKALIKVLFALNVLTVINANENDVHFDFNNYFKVNIATNKPNVLPVTLYNPHIWPGPNDTHPTTTTTTTPMPRIPKRRFAFGLRRSAVDYRNHGYGYDHNVSQHITNIPIETTISPYNRKFYTIDSNNNTNIYQQKNVREFKGFRHTPRNYSNKFPVNPSSSRYIPTRNITRRRYPIYREVTKKPTRWQIFATDSPRFNFSRDLGDFQDIVNKDFSKWRNYSGDINHFSVDNRTTNTSFRCNQMSYFGYYADIESNCKIFHICTPDGRKASFVCPMRLRFNQELAVCDWRRNVDCRQSPNFYDINLIKFDHWNKPLFFSSRKK